MEEFAQTPTITAVEPRGGFKVWVAFSDGVSGEFDAAAVVEWTVSESYDLQPGLPPHWNDRALFESVRVDEEGWTLLWGKRLGDGQDIWIDDYRAYAGVLGRPPNEVSVEWWGEDPESIKYPRLINVEALERYRLLLEYDDGVSGEVDMSHLVGSGVFSLWNDAGKFNQCQIGQGGTFVYWSDQVDSCAFHLYERITGIDLHDFSGVSATTAAAD